MAANNRVFAYVGTFTAEESDAPVERNAHGKGISVYSIDRNTGIWELVEVMEDHNPSVLAFGKNKEYLYCANSGSKIVSAYRIDKETGRLSLLNRMETAGRNVIVLDVSKKGDCLVSADRSGLLSLMMIEDGAILPPSDALSSIGEKGPLQERFQPGSRPHHVIFDVSDQYVIIPDKGFDSVYSYYVNREQGKLVPAGKAAARRADCPRHVSMHPNGKWCYVNMEFSNNIMALDFNDGALDPFQIVSALPDYYVDTISKTSEITVHPNGRWLYVSNRGYNSLTVFDIDQASGRIAPIQWIESGGKIPRFIAIDPSGTRLFACNQYSDNIVEFEIDPHTGRLTSTGQVIDTPTPVCLIFSDGLYAKRIRNSASKVEGIT